VLYGEFLFHYWKTDPPMALKVARELMAEAERDGDLAKFLTAHFALGIDLAHLDELVPAREHLENAISIFDPAERLPLELELQRVVSLGYLGLTLIALGYPDNGRNRVCQMHAIAVRAKDPFILANALCVTPLAEMYCGHGLGMQAQPQALAALAEKNGFSALLPLAATYRAAALILEGYFEQGVDGLKDSIAAAKVAGSNPFGGALRILAYGLAKAGRVREGLDVVDQALSSSTQAGARRASLHLYHVRGILLAHTPSGVQQAKTSLRMAIRLARQQSAKLAELRATISLAELVAKEGNRRKAHIMLAEIYNWFTEGFDTGDLKEAKALLDELRR
jgi:tetratricopeptide (TPR) repeat protein